MKATLLTVLPPKASRNGNVFQRIEFTMYDGSWAKTDVCPNFRNYRRWIPILKAKPGTYIMGLRLRKGGEVDADNFPGIIDAIQYKDDQNNLK